MKVQTKISLLLVAVVATFLSGLFALRAYEGFKFRHIAEERFRERNVSFDEFLQYHGQPLETLARDFTTWDQMVAAIASGDAPWFRDNLSSAVLESFHANAAWVLGPEGAPVFALNNLNAGETLEALGLPRAALGQIFASAKLVHFFLETPQGLLELRGGSIHPSRDAARETPARGYFFAGRLWSQPALREMSLFTGNEVTLVRPAPRVGANSNNERNGLIAFSRVLRGWDGQPLAELVVRNESPIVRALNRSSERLLAALVGFSVALLFLLALALVLWVSRPLRRTMESLQRNDPRPIARLAGQRSEFGALARTIQKFFEQRDNLVREMEERRAAEEALRQSEEERRHAQKMEAIGRLAGGVAHDFNNLLTAIIGYAELVRGRSGHDPVVRQHADLILKAGEQAAGVTRQLLAFSRKQILQPRVIDLNQLVREMEKLLRRVIGERFELRTETAACEGRVLADPTQLGQVLMNLGVNARDAMGDAGCITIRTANVRLDAAAARAISKSLAAGDYVEFSVADSGAGMDAETRAHLFEPFFTTKGPGKGTGLGLATVYGIVRQSGGGITVESAPGAGSTFRVFLPQESAPVEETRALTPSSQRGQHFETILVAEDEEIVRELVCAVLEEEGYTVLCAPDAAGALRAARAYEGKISLLVTDVIMPQTNGPELAALLAAERPEMKVLFVSGYSDTEFAHDQTLEERTELLQKPFTPETLARKVREVIEEHQHVAV